MTTVFIRTFIIYFSLIFFMKLMGKRQVGELEISELVSTLLLSEIVSMPIENSDVPLLAALVPMLIIISLEIILSFAITKSEFFKRILSGKPAILINKGVLDVQEMAKARMSAEELMSELRLKGIGDIEDVNYAMLEQNGQISVILKKAAAPLTTHDMSINSADTGISHLIIVDSVVRHTALYYSGKSKQWLEQYLSKNDMCIDDIFLMSVNDAGDIKVVYKKGRESDPSYPITQKSHNKKSHKRKKRG